jgi:hypothetical protein
VYNCGSVSRELLFGESKIIVREGHNYAWGRLQFGFEVMVVRDCNYISVNSKMLIGEARNVILRGVRLWFWER